MPSDPVTGLCDGPVRALVDAMDAVKAQGGYTVGEGAMMDSIRELCVRLIEATRS